MNSRGTNLDSVRRHNLSMILRLVHREGAVSRAELTRETGLNRSTIAALVGELTALGLVAERVSDAARGVGRPSPVVTPGTGILAFAVNPELDAITVGVVRLGGTVVAQVRHDVEGPLSVAEAVAVTAAMLADLSGEIPRDSVLVGIGVAVPGLVRAADGLVRLAPHLGWIDEPFAEALADATGHPVFAGNDATLGAIAEQIFGAGRGASDLIYLNGGASGIGGGVIANGSPLGGTGGYAGEFGHNVVTAPLERLADPGPGTGSETVDLGRATTLEDEVNRARLLEVLGLEHADPVALERAILESDDPVVVAEVRRQLSILSVALRNAINVLNPELVVLGGFLAAIAARDEALLDGLVEQQTLGASYEGVRIVRAALGADLLMIAAAELAFAPLLDDPASLRRASADADADTSAASGSATALP